MVKVKVRPGKPGAPTRRFVARRRAPTRPIPVPEPRESVEQRREVLARQQLDRINQRIEQRNQAISEARQNLNQVIESDASQEQKNQLRTETRSRIDTLRVEIGGFINARRFATGQFTTKSVIDFGASRGEARLSRIEARREFVPQAPGVPGAPPGAIGTGIEPGTFIFAEPATAPTGGQVTFVGKPVATAIAGGVLVQQVDPIQEATTPTTEQLFTPVPITEENFFTPAPISVPDVRQRGLFVERAREFVTREREGGVSIADVVSFPFRETQRQARFTGEFGTETVFALGEIATGRRVRDRPKKVVKKVISEAGIISAFALPVVGGALIAGATTESLIKGTEPGATDIQRLEAGITSTIGLTFLGRPVARKITRFFAKPIVRVPPPPKTDFTSKDVILQTPKFELAKFTVIAETPPRVARVTTRFEEVVGRKLTKLPEFIEVSPARRTVVISDPFIIKSGKVIGTAAFVRQPKRGGITLGRLKGEFKGEEISLVKDLKGLPPVTRRQIVALAEEKAGRPVSLEFAPDILGKDIPLQRGFVVGRDIFKVRKTLVPSVKGLDKALSKTGIGVVPTKVLKVTPIRRGRAVTEAELLGVVKEARLPKKLEADLKAKDIEVFETLTAVSEIGKRKIPVIRGVTLIKGFVPPGREPVTFISKLPRARLLKLKALRTLQEAKAVTVKLPKFKRLTTKQITKAISLPTETLKVGKGVSSFAKLGLIERAEQVEVVPRRVTIGQRADITPREALREGLATRQVPRLITKQTPRQITRLTTKQVPRLTTRQVTRLTSRLVPRLLTRLTTRQVTRIPARAAPRISPRPPRRAPVRLLAPLLLPKKLEADLPKPRTAKQEEDELFVPGFTARTLGLRERISLPELGRRTRKLTGLEIRRIPDIK